MAFPGPLARPRRITGRQQGYQGEAAAIAGGLSVSRWGRLVPEREPLIWGIRRPLSLVKVASGKRPSGVVRETDDTSGHGALVGLRYGVGEGTTFCSGASAR